MNLFVFNEDPTQAAFEHPNKLLVKMPIETAQLLCGAHHVLNPEKYDVPYKKTHINHPCAKWVRTSKENYLSLGFCEKINSTLKFLYCCFSMNFFF